MAIRIPPNTVATAPPSPPHQKMVLALKTDRYIHAAGNVIYIPGIRSVKFIYDSNICWGSDDAAELKIEYFFPNKKIEKFRFLDASQAYKVSFQIAAILKKA